MTLGELLRKARKRLKKDQLEIATELEKTQPTVSAWENDTAVPGLRDLSKVAKAYGLHRDDLTKCEMPLPERP